MAEVVEKEFDELRIDYLVENPYLVDPEGQFGRATVKAVLNRRKSPWSLVFTTADGRHKIYERSRHARSVHETQCAADALISEEARNTDALLIGVSWALRGGAY
jgi:hypothetical protein